MCFVLILIQYGESKYRESKPVVLKVMSASRFVRRRVSCIFRSFFPVCMVRVPYPSTNEWVTSNDTDNIPVQLMKLKKKCHDLRIYCPCKTLFLRYGQILITLNGYTGAEPKLLLLLLFYSCIHFSVNHTYCHQDARKRTPEWGARGR